MDTTHLISIQQFCKHYQVPMTFISALKDYELVEITITETDQYIKTTQINTVEKMMRLHYDLDINLEGIDAIYNLLQQVERLQEEVITLRNKLNTYQ
ncbi:MAG: chaperone modulator CbpM [Bizionia sp.]|nr:chaperone modulator CbpM [Bizionia sp.]